MSNRTRKPATKPQAPNARYRAEFARITAEADVADTLWAAFDAAHESREQQAFDTETPYNPYAPAYGSKVAEAGKLLVIYTGRKHTEDTLPSKAVRNAYRVYFKYGTAGAFSRSGAVLTMVSVTRPDGSAHDGGRVAVSLSVFDESEDVTVRDVVGELLAGELTRHGVTLERP